MSATADGSNKHFRALGARELELFLARRRLGHPVSFETGLAELLIKILQKAQAFVPSEAGSIQLDDPSDKSADRGLNSLSAVASFDESTQATLGRQLPADRGMARRAYLTGTVVVACSPSDESAAGLKEADRSIRSVLAVPIRLEKDVCGTLELINRCDAGEFSQRDQDLLEILAGYISVSIENVLDGRHAQEIAKRDNLTGLYNDRHLHIELSRIIDLCRTEDQDLSVLFLDLDFFKRVNDSHGHLTGSQVLREVGALLKEASEWCKAIAARYGGDEYVLAVPGMVLSDAVEWAEQIRVAILSNTFCTEPGDILPEALNLSGITCSIGVASLKSHLGEETSAEHCKTTLLRLADSAMYVAKETGRNRSAVAGAPVRRRELEPAER